VPLLLRLASPDVAHVLIAGTTGSGKTELARTILASLTLHQKPHNLLLALFDPKLRGFAPFAQLPHLLFPIARDPAEMLARMSYLTGEMERRENDAQFSARPRIVIAIDELADALQTCGRALGDHLTRLVQRGRSAGISVIACTQKPAANIVGTLLKANFPVRLVGRVASAEDARVAAGIGGTGAEKLAGRGDFVLIAGGQTIRFQVAQMNQDIFASSVNENSGSENFAARMMARLRRVK
jgi:S-DNA-T family DNA segregation ATPase FtsK/SpoIIIE